MNKQLTPLEALGNLKTLVESSCLHFAEDLAKPIETALKALEIIKDIITIDSRDIGNNRVCVIIDGTSKIQKEEFDLLKEVLKK